MTSLLEVDRIDVHYGAVQALRGVSLSVGAGEMVALLGANGAGKTTTLRAVSGALTPSAGEIRLDGERIDGRPAHRVVARGISHLPEGRALFAGLTVLENLRLGYWTQRGDREGLDAALDRVMDAFPILRERAMQPAGTLSGGEQQMLAVARATMASPRLLVVDELSLGLAPMVVGALFGTLRTINATGTSILLVEQFVHMALEHTHRAYVLAKGEVILEGPSEELRSSEDLIASYLGSSEPPAGLKRDRRRSAL